MGLILDDLYRAQISGEVGGKKEALARARALKNELGKESKD